MKKFATLILTLLYMSSSTGATFHMHYCMGKLVAVNLWHKNGKKCDKCGAGENSTCRKNCCKDEHKTVKLEKDQKITENAVHFPALAAVASPVPFIEVPQPHTVSLAEKFPISHAPPRSGKVTPQILYCTFLI